MTFNHSASPSRLRRSPLGEYYCRSCENVQFRRADGRLGGAAGGIFSRSQFAELGRPLALPVIRRRGGNRDFICLGSLSDFLAFPGWHCIDGPLPATTEPEKRCDLLPSFRASQAMLTGRAACNIRRITR